jgi:hypothetical protein
MTQAKANKTFIVQASLTIVKISYSAGHCAVTLFVVVTCNMLVCLSLSILA